MSEYNIQIEKLCESLGLGEIIADVSPISGGFLHRMFDVTTTKGRFAIKALNPNITSREGVVDNYILSEKIANKLKDTISVSFANMYNDQYIHVLEGQYYLVYDFISGKTILQDEITPEHSYKIGQAVAKIHNTDFSDFKIENDNSREERIFDWELLRQEGEKQNSPWLNLYSENIDKITLLSKKMNKSYAELLSNEIICHGDLDPKNVLWQGENPILIDWESVWFYNPYHDFLRTALYWSQKSDLSIDRELFSAFVESYVSISKLDLTDWETVFYSCFSGGWLEYNLRRSLGMECADDAEKQLGTEQVFCTLNEILVLESQKEIILDCLRKCLEHKE